MKLIDVQGLLIEMIRKKVPVTPFLWGRHGIGKSSIIREVARAVDYRLIDRRLSQLEAVDLLGYPYFTQDRELGIEVADFHPQRWLVEACKRGKTIIFLDEMNQSRKEVQNAAFQLVLDRQLGSLKLPDDVFVVAAGNPEDDRYDVTPMNEALKDRFLHIQVTGDTSEWIAWANRTGLSTDIARFISKTPAALYSANGRDDQFPVEIKHSERSWERLDRIKKLNLSGTVQSECFRGIVGADIALAFQRSIGGDLPLTGKQILEADPEVELKLSEWLKDGEPPRTDILTASVDNLVIECKANPTSLEAKDRVFSLIAKLPADTASMALAKIHDLPKWSQAIVADASMKAKMEEIRSLRRKEKKA